MSLVGLTNQIAETELPMQPGDQINYWDIPPASVPGAGAHAYLGSELCKAFVYRTGAGAVTDTFPTATDWINNLTGANGLITPPANELYGVQPNRSVQLQWPASLNLIQPGSSFRFRIINTAAAIVTMGVVASSGVSLYATGNTAIAASSWRDYVAMIACSAAPILLQGNTATSVNVTGIDGNLINNLVAGMSVYGSGVAAGTTIYSVNRDNGSIVLSAATTTTVANNALTFTPTIVVAGMGGGPF